MDRLLRLCKTKYFAIDTQPKKITPTDNPPVKKVSSKKAEDTNPGVEIFTPEKAKSLAEKHIERQNLIKDKYYKSLLKTIKADEFLICTDIKKNVRFGRCKNYVESIVTIDHERLDSETDYPRASYDNLINQIKNILGLPESAIVNLSCRVTYYYGIKLDKDKKVTLQIHWFVDDD